jgi:hypothetical protein
LLEICKRVFRGLELEETTKAPELKIKICFHNFSSSRKTSYGNLQWKKIKSYPKSHCKKKKVIANSEEGSVTFLQTCLFEEKRWNLASGKLLAHFWSQHTLPIS